MSVEQQAFQARTTAQPNTALRILMVMAAQGVSTPIEFDFVVDGSKPLTDLYDPGSVDQLPNLILLDLHMPQFNGQRTLESPRLTRSSGRFRSLC